MITLRCAILIWWQSGDMSIWPLITAALFVHRKLGTFSAPVGGEIDARVSPEHQIPTKSRHVSDFIEPQLLI